MKPHTQGSLTGSASNMGTVTVHIVYRLQRRWSGGYTKAQFLRVVHPVFERFNVPLLKEITPCQGRIYQGKIGREDALLFRQELYGACKLLDRDPLGFDYKD